MGQQQLLLLVLATVIVGLATVAGIQAFDEGQQQATMDALTQRSIEIATDLKAAHEKPSSMGGIDLGTLDNSTRDQAANAIGLSSATGIAADGAGGNATCNIDFATGDDGSVVCGTATSSPAGAAQAVRAEIDIGTDNQTEVIETSVISVTE